LTTSLSQGSDRAGIKTTLRDQSLAGNGLATLDKAIQRAGAYAPRDQIVAKLTVDFWLNLFRPEYGALWRTNVNIAFPNLHHGQSCQEIRNLVKPINVFRNRVAQHEPLAEKHQAIICLDDKGRPTAAFTVVEAVRFISESAKGLGGMIDLEDHTVLDLLKTANLVDRGTQMDDATPLALAVKELQKPRIQILVGIEAASWKATGAILRAHRRY
jgi:hypothetical protein